MTVYLRAVSVRTGEVLNSVTASKTISSVAVDTNLFRYIASDRLMEAENGFTTNEPGQVALQQAVEKAVYAMVLDGVDLNLWHFQDGVEGALLLNRYHDERDGRLSAVEAQGLARVQRRSAPPRIVPDRGPDAANRSTSRLARNGETPASSAPAPTR